MRVLLIAFALSLAGCATHPARERSLAAVPSPIHNSWGARFLRAMEYIDFPDVLVGIAARNDRIWERYENGERASGRKTTLEERWNTAISTPLPGTIDQQLIAIAQVLTEGGFKALRGFPIDDAGGDFGGYDRLTIQQLKALQSNPVLVVETKLDMDNQEPGRRPNDGSTILARYRYPSAGTWKKFQSLLSPGLQQELAAAEAAGKLKYDLQKRGSAGPEFLDLTRKILVELLRKAIVPTDPPALNYQRLIAVHPFTDYNGRSLRAWYRQKAGAPLFMLDFYCDLYCSPDDFQKEIKRGQAQYSMIVQGMQREEQRSPQMPRFYEEVPDYWLVAAGLSTPARDPSRLISRSTAWWNDPKNSQRVDSKRFYEVLKDYALYILTFSVN